MSDQRGPGTVRLATPWVVGALTAVVTGLTLALSALRLPGLLVAAIIVGATVVAGLIAWAAQRSVVDLDQPVSTGEVEGRAPAQLPPVIAHFTGRTENLARLRQVVDSRKRIRGATSPLVVSIHGPGGVGKSALAARFAHEIASRYPDGQLYFDLRGTSGAAVRADDVLLGFLAALGVRLTTDPGGLPELQKLWWTWVKGRRILIVLDNAHDSVQVQALLPPEPGCVVLVTSRQQLSPLSTHQERLSEFTESQAIELLSRLAGNDRIAADLESAVKIVELCDHLPLAIGICGGRLAIRDGWPLRELADRLSDERRRRLDELEVGTQLDQSVRATLWLSYDDCTDLQRRLLRRLGVLSVPDLPGWVAGALLDTSELDGGDQLDALVDAQLVVYSGRDDTGGARYRQHELVRLFARERAESEDAADLRRAAIERVLRGYRQRAELAAAARWPQDWQRQRSARGRPGAGTEAAEWFAAERLVLLAGIDQAVDLQTWELVWRLGRAFCSLCHSLRAFWPEWRIVAETTFRAAERMNDPRSLGIALLDRAAVAGGLGQIDVALADAREAHALFRRLREPWWAARATRTVGMTLRSAGNLDDGQRYLMEAIEAFTAEGDHWWQARTQRNLAELRLSQGRQEEARGLLETALDIFRTESNKYSEAQTLRVLGEVLGSEARALRGVGDHQAAERKYNLAAPTLERAAESFRLRHEQWEEARCLRAAGEVGDPKNGLRELSFVRHAKDMLEGLGDSWGVARTLHSEGAALSRLGRIPEAVVTLRQAADSFALLGDRWLEARCLRTLAEVLVDAGRLAEAHEPASQALEIYRRLGNQVGEDRARAVLSRAAGVRASD